MMDKESLEGLSESQFRRLTGLKRPIFQKMVQVLHVSQRFRKGGNRRRLSLEACLMMTLEYWREYRTQFHIAHSYGVDEATVNRTIRWVEDTLIGSGEFSLPGRKALLNARNMVETIIGHIKEFSSLRLPRHRSVTNAIVHLLAAIIAYQLNPLPYKAKNLIGNS